MNAPRDPDAISTTSGEAHYLFEDLTEHGAIKLDSLLRICAPVHWPLFQKSLFSADYRARTGMAGIIYFMELEASDRRAAMPRSAPATVDVTMTLGRSAGDDPRIISRGEMVLTCAGATGRFDPRPDTRNPVTAGRMRLDHVLTRITAPPDQRRVRELPADLGFSKNLPDRILPFHTAEEILRPPEPFSVKGSEYRDLRAKFWAYNRTDPNEHVHAMDYVRAAEDLATDALALEGEPPEKWFFSRASVLYKRPMFTGNAHIRVAQVWRTPAKEPGVSAVTLAFFPLKAARDLASHDPGKPSVCVRLVTMPKQPAA